VDPGSPPVQNAERLVRRLSRLRGAAMKAGQMLSMEAGDLLPPEIAERLSALRADGDAMQPAQLEESLRHAWGGDWRSRVRCFDDEPMAAASIGQVHEAVAADGSELAIKIQFPGVARSIDSDVDNLAGAFKLARILPAGVEIDPVVAATKQQLQREADYRREAANLERYAELLADDPDVVVPRVYQPLTTKRVLAMQRLRGVPLEDLCGAQHAAEARDRTGALLIRLMLRELFELRFMQTDPNFANYLWLEDGRVGLLDLGAGQRIPAALSRGYEALFRSASQGDRAGLSAAAREIGFISADDPMATREGLLELILLATEPFRARGPYDFGSSDLPARAREAGMRFVATSAVTRPPPAATLFVQRKLGGTFLLCHRLRARVDARGILEATLRRSQDEPARPMAAA